MSAKEPARLWEFHKQRCEVCQSGARCERGAELVYNLIKAKLA